MAGSAGRRKRLLDLRAQGERDEDEKDSGVVLFSDEPELQSPVQPDETAPVIWKRSSRLRDLSKGAAGDSIFCCSVCHKAFSSSSSLDAHHKAHHETHTAAQRPHPCTLCPRSFRRPCLLREHMKSHGPAHTDPPEPRRTQDPVIKSAASEPSDLDSQPFAGNHGDPAGVPEEDEDAVAECGEEVVSGLINSDGEEEDWKDPSRTGQKVRTPASPAVAAAAFPVERSCSKPRHCCPVCGRDCLKASALQKHLRVHSGERPFQCPVCRKSFTQHVHMTEHLRIHTGEKPYACTLCGRRFTFSSALRRHQRLHADVRPFQCAVCHKSFKQRSSLKGHQLVHTGVRFPCPVCSKSFSRPLELNYHVGTHSSSRPYYCHTCQKNLSGARVYRKHLKRHQVDPARNPGEGEGEEGEGEEEEQQGEAVAAAVVGMEEQEEEEEESQGEAVEEEEEEEGWGRGAVKESAWEAGGEEDRGGEEVEEEVRRRSVVVRRNSVVVKSGECE